MADKVINVDIKTNVTGVKNLRTELRETKEALQQATDPAQVDRLVRKAAELQDKMQDVNEQVAVFASGSKYEQVNNSLGSIGRSLGNLDFGKASERANDFAKAAGQITFKDAITSVKQLGSTFISIGKAILTNPLFLLGAVIAAIVVGIYKLLDSLGIIKNVFDAIGEAVGWVIQQLKDLLDWLGLTSFAADEEAEKEKARQASIKAAREQAFNQYMKEKELEIRKLKATGTTIEQIEDAEIELAQTRANASAKQLQQEEKAMEFIIARLKALGQLNVATQLQADLDKLRNKAAEDAIALLETEQRVQDARAARAKAAADKAKAEREKIDAEKKKKDDEAAALEQKRLEALDKLQKEYAFRQLSDEEQRVAKRKEQLKNELLIAGENEALRLQLIREAQQDEADIRDQFRQAELAEMKKQSQKIKDDNQKRIDDALALEQALFDMKRNLTNMALNSLLANLKQGSIASKGVAVAQATYDTFKGVQAIFANAAANPSTILFPAQPYIQAAAAGAFGIANIRKILSTSPTSSSAPSGGGAAPSFSQPNATPSFSLFGQANEGNNVNAGAQVNEAQPFMVKIGIDEVTDTQNRVGRMRLNAEI
jgi:hypothetical protein